VFVYRVLRGVLGSKRYDVMVEWRKQHNGELNDPTLLTRYRSGDQIEKNELGGACSTLGESTGVFKVLVGTPKEK
jgi:hypothetical protein